MLINRQAIYLLRRGLLPAGCTAFSERARRPVKGVESGRKSAGLLHFPRHVLQRLWVKDWTPPLVFLRVHGTLRRWGLVGQSLVIEGCAREGDLGTLAPLSLCFPSTMTYSAMCSRLATDPR